MPIGSSRTGRNDDVVQLSVDSGDGVTDVVELRETEPVGRRRERRGPPRGKVPLLADPDLCRVHRRLCEGGLPDVATGGCTVVRSS